MAAGRCSRFGALGAFLLYAFILTLSVPKFQSNPVEANISLKLGGKHFGYGKNIVATTFVFPSLMTSFKKRLKKQSERSSQGETLIIILCLLLSGDVHQCPGPISNSGDSDNMTGRGGAVHAHPAGSKAASVSEHFHFDLPSHSTHGDLCFGCTEQDMRTAENVLHEDKWYEGAINEQPGLESDQLGYSSRDTEGERRGAAGSTRRRNATEGINLRQKRSNLSHSKPQSRRYDLTLLHTLNHAKVIWDAKSKPKGLLGGHLNVRSISSKTDQVEKLLTDSNLDFICLSETWLTKTSPQAAYCIPGYSIFRRDRSTGRGGGLLFYVKEHLQCQQINVQDKLDVEIECIALTVNVSPQMSFILAGFYRPPSTDAKFYTSFKEILKELNTLGKEVIVLGDFNVNWIDKNSRKRLKEIIGLYNFEQLIQGPTRITKTSKTQIDLVFSNKSDRIIKSFNFITGMSDHNLVLIARKLNKNRFTFRTNKKEAFYKIPNKDLVHFDQELEKVDWNILNSNDEIGSFCGGFLDLINKVKVKFIKKCVNLNRKAHLPWLTKDIWKLMRRRDYLLKKALKSNIENDMRLFKDYRNKVVKELRTTKANFFIDLITKAKGNNHLVWKHINTISRKKTSQKRYEIKINNVLTQEESKIASAFNSFF